MVEILMDPKNFCLAKLTLIVKLLWILTFIDWI